MISPPRSWSLAGVTLTLLLAGCTTPAPSPQAAVRVHVVNRIANVVVTSGDLLAAAGVRTPANGGQTYIASCGGEADIQAPIEGSAGGLLVLLIDPSGALDRAYPLASTGAPEATFQVSIIWSNGELKPDDWIVVAPGGVTTSAAPPASLDSSTCAPWIGEQTPS